MDGVGDVADELDEQVLGDAFVLRDVPDHLHDERVLVVEGPLHQDPKPMAFADQLKIGNKVVFTRLIVPAAVGESLAHLLYRKVIDGRDASPGKTGISLKRRHEFEVKGSKPRAGKDFFLSKSLRKGTCCGFRECYVVLIF